MIITLRIMEVVKHDFLAILGFVEFDKVKYRCT